MSKENGHQGERVIEEIRSLKIPSCWVKTTVGEVGEVRLGRQRSPKNRSANFPTKYIRAANITWNGLDLSDVMDMEFRPSELETYRLQLGDVLLSEASGSAGEVGKPAIWNGELEDCCFQNTVIRFRSKTVKPKFALAVFQHFARNRVFAQVSKGVGIHHLSADRFASMPFFLPPRGEQDRIVAKIEELFSDMDAGVAALERAKANLKRYRAAVLKAAVEGKLTEGWRAEHPNTEPASKLLARILTERRQKWEADQLAKFAAANKQPPKNWRDKYVEPTPPDTSGLPELPEGWCWASVEQLAAYEKHSLAIGPFGSNLKVSDYADTGVPLVFVRNIRSNDFGQESTRFVIPEKAHELDAHSVEGGDILITKMGDPPGDSCLYPTDQPKAIITADCIKFRLYPTVGQPMFFVHAINSYLVRPQILEITSGVAQQKVSLGRFISVALPIAPRDEQELIVSIIAEKLSQIDAAEIAINHGLVRASRLRQSILKQAFEGKLVPQDPNDEPASLQVDKVRAEHQPRPKENLKYRTRKMNQTTT